MSETRERELATRAICALNSGGYCDCVGESLGCKVGHGEPAEAARCKMTPESMPLTAEYRMASAAIEALSASTQANEVESLRDALAATHNDRAAMRDALERVEADATVPDRVRRYVRAALSAQPKKEG